MNRYRRVIEDMLKSCDDACRVTEVAIAVNKFLNHMGNLGQAICAA
jgi:hypothetical protein